MHEIALAPNHDAAAYAQVFARTGRIHIPRLLREADAERLHEALVRRTPWNLALLHDIPRNMPLSQWEGLSDFHKRHIEEEVAAAARERFEGRFLSYVLTETGAPLEGVSPELTALSRFFNSEPFLSFVRTVIGNNAVAYADVQATQYRANDFLNQHNDDLPGNNRLVAYVLNLTPLWKPEWGGLLCFPRADGHVGEAYVPAWNALNLLKVPQNHFVSSVASFVNVGRYALTGWLRHR